MIEHSGGLRPVPEGRRPGGPSRRGFTLVEVVVALTILSLILLATLAALRTFGNTQSSLERVTQRVDEIRTVSGFLRDSLEAAVVGEELTGGLTLGGPSGDPPYFQGDAESFAWKAPVLFGEAYGGVFLVRVARDADTLVLQWQEPSRFGKDVTWDDTPNRILVDEVDEFAVAFRPEYDQPWQDRWEQKGSPALVRIALKVAGRYWPDLILKVQRQ